MRNFTKSTVCEELWTEVPIYLIPPPNTMQDMPKAPVSKKRDPSNHFRRPFPFPARDKQMDGQRHSIYRASIVSHTQNGGNVTSAGWQVTLCDPMWHVSSRSGVATLRTTIHLLLTYLPV